MTDKTKYTEIASAPITKSRKIVISHCSRGGYTIAQQLDVAENGKVTSVFLKGAFHVDDLHGLYNLRDALNLVIARVEGGDGDEDDVTWDPESI